MVNKEHTTMLFLKNGLYDKWEMACKIIEEITVNHWCKMRNNSD